VTWIEPITLKGRFVRLEPLTQAHANAMREHYDPIVETFMSRGAPKNTSLAAMEAYIEMLNSEPSRLNFAICIQNSSDVAGRISYSEIRAAHKALEIGTMISPKFQGGFCNPESKLLMLEHAFSVLGAVRVQFKADARNERSLKALEKLGATREGVLRKYQTRPDGFVRDSVVFSILDSEWEAVKTNLDRRLSILEFYSGFHIR
jgi:N-acetyltransferase